MADLLFMMVISNLHLAPSLRISGAIPLLLLHGVDRDNFTFTFTFLIG